MTRLTDAQVNCLREVAQDGLPSGSSKTINSVYYRWKGQCIAMETLTRSLFGFER